MNSMGSHSLQMEIIDKLTEVMYKMRVKGKITIVPFQKGAIITNNTLKHLYADLKNEYNISYTLTYRLNQDVLENFFGTIRSKGGLYDHPDRLEFMYRIRAYILGRNEGSLSLNGNTLDRYDLDGTSYLTGSLLKELNPEFAAIEEQPDELELIQYDGLEHLAGYICHRLRNPDSEVEDGQQESSFTWTNQLTEGFLQEPTRDMMANMERMEAVFKQFNKDEIVYSRNYLKK